MVGNQNNVEGNQQTSVWEGNCLGPGQGHCHAGRPVGARCVLLCTGRRAHHVGDRARADPDEAEGVGAARGRPVQVEGVGGALGEGEDVAVAALDGEVAHKVHVAAAGSRHCEHEEALVLERVDREAGRREGEVLLRVLDVEHDGRDHELAVLSDGHDEVGVELDAEGDVLSRRGRRAKVLDGEVLLVGVLTAHVSVCESGHSYRVEG